LTEKAGVGRRWARVVALDKDWTRGPIARNLLLLSWPMVVMEALWAVSQINDLIWVGRLGAQSIAGVGIANIFLMLVYSVDMGLTVGVRAMVARYIGAGDIKGANHVAAQAILLAAMCGLVITVLGIFLAGPILSLFGADSAVLKEGTDYIRLMFMGWVGFEVLVIGLYTLQSSGDGSCHRDMYPIRRLQPAAGQNKGLPVCAKDHMAIVEDRHTGSGDEPADLSGE
jgi:Na+-driven multidrug efflux pump